MAVRCLCVILTLWMVWQSPSPPILPEAPDFGAWWGTPESKTIAKQADKARRSGDLTSAERFYKQGYDEALRRKDERAMVGYLNGIAACQLTGSHYQAALGTLLEAKRRAKSLHERVVQGAIAVNLSSVYFQVYDFESAMREAEEGRAAVAKLKRPYYLPNLLLQLARLHEKRQRDGSSVSLYRQGIEAARAAENKQLEALGLDLLGEALLGENRLDQAERAIGDGIRLRETLMPKDLGYSWGWMGGLKFKRGDWTEAARYTNLALQSPSHLAEYLLKNQRGQIRMALGQRAEALADLEDAVQSASQWRVGLLPASASLTAANQQLQQLVFSSFIEAAAKEALRTNDQRWAEESFEALELNRAASLRESLALAEAWHRKAPAEYWETLEKLRVADSRSVGGQSEESRRLRLELVEMEAKAGLGFPVKNTEIFRSRSSLIHFQRGIGRSEVLLSFHLGDTESYRWEVTRESLRLRKIGTRDHIRERIQAFAGAIRVGGPEAVELGRELYGDLFGQLGQEAAAKPSWLLSLEGELFQVPFAALVTEQKGGNVKYLVSEHSMQTIPGALLLSTRSETGTGWFLGVGDPIYNVADPRWVAPKHGAWGNIFQPAKVAVPFGRLVGSAAELAASAGNWDGKSTVLLEGPAARRELFLAQLEKSPSIIHLATHVVSSGSTALIAFGLGTQGQTEFLTTTDVASLRVPGALVALTGCGTASGEVVDGAGLLGLTRAWQMAGAGAVLATSWPVLDSTGDIPASFYKYLRHGPAADALRQSQLEMIRSGTWRARPSYWAAYQITGGAR